MGDWVLQRLHHFGVDISAMQQIKGAKTSSSIVTTRADGTRPALHMKGATGDFYVDDVLHEAGHRCARRPYWRHRADGQDG